MNVPAAPTGRVLDRVSSIWTPDLAAHILLLGSTGAGKSRLIRTLAGLRPDDRLLLITPKPSPDPVYAGFARPVLEVGPGFGRDYEGGGPNGLWFEIYGQPDQDAGERSGTARRIGQALETVFSEGHCIVVVDDAKFVCTHLGLAKVVDRIAGMSRSSKVSVILASTELAYLAGRRQAALVFVGFTGGSLEAAVDAAKLLGWRGKADQDICARVPRHGWIYQDHEAGGAGPCLLTPSLDEMDHYTGRQMVSA